MDYKYKKIKKDWTSRDLRFHYRKDDEVMVLKEDDKYHTVALDVAIVDCIPNEYFDDGDEIKDAGVMGLVMSKYTKDLLLKDLCARLPYKVCINDRGTSHKLVNICWDGFKFVVNSSTFGTGHGHIGTPLFDGDICFIKPYLRPMSSMTRKELHECQEILGTGVEIQDDFIHIIDSSIKRFTYLEIDAVFAFLNKKMFDIRELIPKGLALEAPEGMYNL